MTDIKCAFGICVACQRNVLAENQCLVCDAEYRLAMSDELIEVMRKERDDANLDSADLRAALRDLTTSLGPFLCTADAGLPAVVRTLGQSADLHSAYRRAVRFLEKDEGDTIA